MTDSPRWFVPGTVLMLTSRTLEGRFYMVANRREVNEIIVGVVAMGQERHGVLIHGVVFMSNHFHMVVTGDNTEQIAAFMKYVKVNLSTELNRLRRREGTMWHRRYDMELCDGDEMSQVGMLAYVLAHGAKEGLVEQPQMWPGVHSAAELLDGDDATSGIWTRRTAMGRTTEKVVAENPERFYVSKTIDLTPLPTLADRGEDERQAILQTAVNAAIAKGHDEMAAEDEAARAAGKNPRPRRRPAKSAAEAAVRARQTSWKTKVSSPAKKHLRVRQPAPWRRRSSVEAIKAVRGFYAEASKKHRAGEACRYPAFTIPAWLRMGEDEGVTFKRLVARVRKEWRKRPKTGIRQGPGTFCRARPPPVSGR